MKLQREKFLAAAMMLSTATAGACRSKVDQGNEGIAPEGAENIGQSSPNGQLGADLAGGQNRAIQPLGAKGGGFAPAPLRAPTGEGIVAPTNEKYLPAPTNEKIVAAPTNEKIVAAPTNEKIVAAPTNEKGVLAPKPLVAPVRTLTPRK